MPSNIRTLFVLGGTGFVGRHVLAAAVGAGFVVQALTRREATAPTLRAAGVEPVLGDAMEPSRWVDTASRCDVVVDLTQPALPARLTTRAIRAVAAQRLAGARALTTALGNASGRDGRRPLLVIASGVDDLQPDASGTVHDDSALRQRPRGFGHIGIPVRRAIEDSGIPATFVYLGNIVYGDGKAFAEQIVPQLRAGRARIVGTGDNRLPLTHVEDAAAALVHVVGLPQAATAGASYIAVPPTTITQREFLAVTANRLGASPPSVAPVWLARAAAGRIAVDTITLDVATDPARLLATGFTFRHADPVKGITDAVAALTAAQVQAQDDLVTAGSR